MMMQVFLPCSLLVLVGIPLWPHQRISWYFPVSLPQAFFIPFDFYSHISSFLLQYRWNSPLTPLQNFTILITISCQGIWLHPYTITPAKLPPDSGSQCHSIMFEADIYLRLLHTSILDIYKVFEPLVCCLKGIWVQPYSITLAKLPQIWGFRFTWGVEWCHNVIVAADIHFRPFHTSILDIYKVFETLRCYLKGIWCTLIPLHRLGWPQIWGLRVTCGVKMMP